MKLPSKVTSYKESVISKFPIVLESLSYSNETPRQLYEKEKQSSGRADAGLLQKSRMGTDGFSPPA